MRTAYEVMFRKMTALGMTAAAIGLLSACAAPSSYIGIALTPDVAAPDVQALAARAVRISSRWAPILPVCAD